MGAKEAAETLGVQQSNLRIVRGLPEPYDTLRATTLWRAEEIRELARRRAGREWSGRNWKPVEPADDEPG
jgi:hypothetical protein